jgi:hypothetical protein
LGITKRAGITERAISQKRTLLELLRGGILGVCLFRISRIYTEAGFTLKQDLH